MCQVYLSPYCLWGDELQTQPICHISPRLQGDPIPHTRWEIACTFRVVISVFVFFPQTLALIELLPESKLERLQFDGVSATSTFRPPQRQAWLFQGLCTAALPHLCPSAQATTLCADQGLTFSRAKQGRGQVCRAAKRTPWSLVVSRTNNSR